MRLLRARLLLISAVSLASAWPALAAPAVVPIANGKYHCIAGSSRMMLTLGDMQVSGMKYKFAAIGGPATSGSYAMTPKGYTWSGDIGAITKSQIVESGPDATPGDFWFKFKAKPTSSPTSVACQKV